MVFRRLCAFLALPALLSFPSAHVHAEPASAPLAVPACQAFGAGEDRVPKEAVISWPSGRSVPADRADLLRYKIPTYVITHTYRAHPDTQEAGPLYVSVLIPSSPDRAVIVVHGGKTIQEPASGGSGANAADRQQPFQASAWAGDTSGMISPPMLVPLPESTSTNPVPWVIVEDISGNPALILTRE